MRRSSALVPLLAAAACLALLTVPAGAAAPTATGLPAISGNARAGQILTSTTGLFAGTAPVTYGRTWQRCDETGAACGPIASAGAATYTLASADVGKTIRVTVTASNLEGSASVTSPATAVVGPLAPPLLEAGGLPLISGTARDGQILNATDGAWSGTAPLTFTRLWRRCDVAGDACTALAGAATHTLTSNDVGATIRIDVTARNADGQGVATSAQTAVIDSAAPVNTVAPALGGPARSGQTLTSSTPGTWSGTIPMTHARQWLRCDAGGGACAAITGATGATLVLTDDDVGHTIRVAVTATNVKSSATASSAASSTVGPRVAPQKGTDPSIGGSPIDGEILTAADGSWTGTAPIATVRRWQRCAPLGVDCADLAGSATTLTLTTADVGSTIRTRVTATNADGTTQALSALTAIVAAAVPSLTTAPSVSATLPREGQLLTAAPGSWKGTPTISYAYTWERCSAGACGAIDAAAGSTHRVAAVDVGKTLRVIVTATNGGGATSAMSAATATVTGGPPVALDGPELSGALPRDGELYSATLGTWAGTAPLVHDRQWLRCNAAGAACAPLSGEISAGYRLAAADLGKTLRIEVTATNAFGATKAQSAPSPVILAAPPYAATGPAIAGVLRDGQTITATGTWGGTAPVSLTYQWQRCDAVATACVDIAGATDAGLRLTSADVGSRTRIRVGALNAGGGGTATSTLADPGDPAGLVAPDAPHATAAPVLSGAAIEEATLSSTDGTFTGTLPLTRSIRWQRCDGAGAGCADIAGATGSERVLGAADRGATLRTIATGVNGSGSDAIASAPSAVVVMAPPRNLIAPSVSPDTGLRDGATLVSTDGGWGGSQPLALAHRWQRCRTVSDCVNVAGAADRTHMLTTADVGFALRLVVTASNGAGSTSQASALTGVVGTNPPVNIVAPTVAGTARDGEPLSAVDGVWTGPIVFQTVYEWWRCDTLGANCTIVAGATGRSLLLGSADIGLTLRTRIVRTSAGGTTGAFSAPTAVVVAAPPQNLVLPQIIGGAALGRTLTAAHGIWSGTPALEFSYQWRRCDAGGSACADIDGAVGATYQPTAVDGAASLRVVVTAANAVGSASATSLTTLEVQTDPPAMIEPPRIEALAGPPAAGATLAADPGTWGGALPISFAYAWARCDAIAAGCEAIAEATARTYLLTTADVGRRIVVTVTATNLVASTPATTDATAKVLAQPPSNATAPTIAPATAIREGTKLAATNGTWNGATPMTFATVWLRCAADGASCAAVSGATAASYTLTPDDIGHRMRLRVTAANTTGEFAADSAATTAVAPAPPLSTAAPSVVALAAKPLVGSQLRGQTGTWSGTAPMTLDVRWQRCPPTSVSACDDVPGATAIEYTVAVADVGRRLRIVVSAHNGAGSVDVPSAPTVVVPAVVVPASAVPPPVAAAKPAGTAAVPATAKAGAAAKAPTPAARKPARPAARPRPKTTRPIAELQRLRITPAGRLLVVLRCRRGSPRACAASGTVVAGTSLGTVIPKTSLAFTLPAATVPRRRTLVRAFTLTTAQRDELRTLKDVNFRVRLAIPGASKRFAEVFVRTRSRLT